MDSNVGSVTFCRDQSQRPEGTLLASGDAVFGSEACAILAEGALCVAAAIGQQIGDIKVLPLAGVCMNAGLVLSE